MGRDEEHELSVRRPPQSARAKVSSSATSLGPPLTKDTIPFSKAYAVYRVQSPSRSFDETHHRAARELRLRRCVCPDLFWLVNRDVVPNHARTIMLSHRMGENSVSVPVLLHSRIVNPPKSDGR